MKTPKSNEFIKWFKKQSLNDETFTELKKEAVYRFANFLSQDSRDLLEHLLPRLEFGRKEYGDKIFSKTAEQLSDEEQQEFADAFVYYMIALFLDGKARKGI